LSDDNNHGDETVDLERLLEQKEQLDKIIKDQYTRVITVMFTDLKGSTAIADLQGDLAARMIIKKHNDILMPIMENNNGVLVKTMGDGTMSYYENPADAVRAGLQIQKSISAYNDTIEGQAAIRIRIGISTGKAIVEEKDIFGDVVNVASRFESSCQPGEIYISENTYEGLGENKADFFIRHIRMIRFKGKSTESKVFKVFWKQAEIEEEKAHPTEVLREGEISKGKETAVPGRYGLPHRRPVAEKSNIGNVKISREQRHVNATENEISGRIIKKGDLLKLTNDKYLVLGDIIIASGAMLSLDNVELYFAENAGIIVLGTIRAKRSTFSAIDPAKRWLNVTISSSGERPSQISNCKFHFGRGRTLESLKASANIVIPSAQKNMFYGGAMLVSGGTAQSLMINQTTCLKSTANEGGGIYFYRSSTQIDGCIFESCIARTGNGGGISAFGSDLTIKSCAFNKCSSGRQGGGLYCLSSKNKISETIFRNCMGKFHGGGLACASSNPLVKECRFEHCSASKSGGGIYSDEKSHPVLEFPSFEKCRPNDAS